jgi:putative hemolysin
MMTERKHPKFKTRLARTAEELRAAQALRYTVFVEELGGTGAGVWHDKRLETDEFDPHFDHLLLTDEEQGGSVVGVYRLATQEQAKAAGRFYTDDEYDLAPLLASGRKLLELGRSCVHRDYRGGPAMFHLWTALAAYVEERAIDVLFGTASFHGTDLTAHAPALSLLHAAHLAPSELRVRSRAFEAMDLIAANAVDRPSAMREMPPLIKAYLRLGGTVGEGAFIDHAFNTIDVCLILDTLRLNERQRGLYSRAQT